MEARRTFESARLPRQGKNAKLGVPSFDHGSMMMSVASALVQTCCGGSSLYPCCASSGGAED
jgi:hypothetical protein